MHHDKPHHDERSPTPLRVGWVVTPLSACGGTVVHLRHWAETLSSDRVRPFLLYARPPDETLPLPLPDSLPRLPVPLTTRSPLEYGLGIGALAEVVRAHGLQLLHSLFIGADLAALSVGRLLGIPVVTSAEGALLAPHLSSSKRAILGMLYRTLSPGFSAITAISTATAAALEPHLSPRAPRPQVLTPSIPTRDARPLPSLVGGVRLLTVGRLAPIKGLPILLQALAIRRGLRPRIHLTLVGEGPERAPLEAQVRTLGLEADVSFKGWLTPEAVDAMLQSSHVLIQPSLGEGLPWSVLEAMARGVPVVASTVGGLSTLLAPEGADPAGVLVPPGNPLELAAALEALLEPDGLEARLTAMGLAAQARVRRQHPAGQEGLALMALYDKVVGRAHTG